MVELSEVDREILTDRLHAVIGFYISQRAEDSLVKYVEQLLEKQREQIAQTFELRCKCYALTHPNHAHDCGMTVWTAAQVVREGDEVL